MPLKRTLPKISATIKTSDGIVTTERLVILTKNNTSTKLFSTKIDSNSLYRSFGTMKEELQLKQKLEDKNGNPRRYVRK